MKVLCVILARGGSKGIPRKNIVDLGGKPLLAWSIECAKACKSIDDVYVSSEDEEILQVALKYGALRITRPIALARDEVWSKDALKDAVLSAECQEDKEYDVVVELNNFCPFRSPEDVEVALSCLDDSGADSVVSLAATAEHPMRCKKFKGLFLTDLKGFPEGEGSRRQDLQEIYYRNGAIYVMRRDLIVNEGKRIGRFCRGYEMPRERSLNIDTPYDLELARAWVNRSRLVIPTSGFISTDEYTPKKRKPTVRIDAPVDFMPNVLEGLDKDFEIGAYGRGRQVDYLIANPGAETKYGVQPLGSATKAIITPSTGTTHIDPDIGIPVHSLADDPGYTNTITASAEYTWALILSLVRNIPQANRGVYDWRRREGDWRSVELGGKSLGILAGGA